MVESSRTLAGFWRRFFADLVDSTILDLSAAIVFVAGFGVWYWIQRSTGAVLSPFWEAMPAFAAQVLFTVLRALLALGYFTFLQTGHLTTPGKKLFKIRVVDATTFRPLPRRQAFIRTCAYAVSYLPLGAGFLMVAFHPRKQGLHDLIAHTISVTEPT